MIFRTFDHYYDDLVINYETNYCFICFEVLCENVKPIKLNSKIYYLKKCNCEGLIHKKCIDEWYNISNSCPLCRNTLVKNTSFISKKLDTSSYFIIFYFFYFFYLKNLIKIKKLFFIIFFIYFTSEFYFICLNRNYLNYYYQNKYRNFNENYIFNNFILNNSSYYNNVSLH
jgi:hypothetical protein